MLRNPRKSKTLRMNILYIKKSDLVNNIEFSQIKDINMNFPNLKNNHISKAT